MSTYSITIDPGSTLTDLQALLYDKLGNLDIFLLDVGQLISDEMAFNFSLANWPPLAAATIAEKQAGGYPLAPLMRTGEMRDMAIGGNWQASGGGGSFAAVLEVPGYSRFHMTGTKFMPIRDFAFLSSDMQGRVAQEFGAFLRA